MAAARGMFIRWGERLVAAFAPGMIKVPGLTFLWGKDGVSFFLGERYFPITSYEEVWGCEACDFAGSWWGLEDHVKETGCPPQHGRLISRRRVWGKEKMRFDA